MKKTIGMWLKRIWLRLGLFVPESIHYIGGSDTLPPPLKREREAEQRRKARSHDDYCTQEAARLYRERGTRQ